MDLVIKKRKRDLHGGSKVSENLEEYAHNVVEQMSIHIQYASRQENVKYTRMHSF